MDITPFSPVTSHNNFTWGFTMALRWAVNEWLLIFMLFADAIISYLVTNFARYSKLQVPCLLCSRLDHIIGKERVGFYWDLVCENHKLEISNKLVHVQRAMSESCNLLLSNGNSTMGKNDFDHLSHTEYPSSALNPRTVSPDDNFAVPREQMITDDLSTDELKKTDSICAPTVLEVLSKPISFDEQGAKETCEMEKKLITETNSGKNPAGVQMPTNLDLGDAYKLAVGNNRRQLSGKFSEQMSLKESLSFNEDLKLLLSQRSFSRGLEVPLNEISPRLSGQIDELKTLLQKRVSLERNESGLSIDGSTISDIEGEGMVDRLKRQVEHDRKLINALYKELEEERNASTIAANQAMAMITKLQEEKAALNMEALQCLRMMEDQADYDVEALEKANGLLAEKEIKIRDIEVELELYRNKFGDISTLEASGKDYACNTVD